MEADLIDSIYEAAVIPDAWIGLLERISADTGSFGGTILAIGQAGPSLGFSDVIRRKSSARYDPVYERAEKYLGHYENPRFTRAVGRGQWYFQTDLDLCTQAELDADPIYIELLRPSGIGSTIGCPISVPSADIIIFDFSRAIADGPFDIATVAYFNALRPHLARAAFVAARLGLERARAAVETLRAMGLPGAALKRSGQVIAANELFEGLAPRIRIGARDRIAVFEPTAAKLLKSAFEEASVTSEVMARSIPLRTNDSSPPLILHLLPVRRAAADIFVRADMLLVVTPVLAAPMAVSHVLGGLFDLTPAEMTLAGALAAGATLQGFADGREISVETARKHLKAVLLKTGTHRQVDLVRLLTSAAALPDEDRTK